MEKKKNNLYLLLLLFAILPYNYSALLLNNFASVINVVVYAIRIFLLVYVISYMKKLKLSEAEKKAFVLLTIYFVFIFSLNLISSLAFNHTSYEKIIIRSFSMLYMYGFYVYMIYNYKHFDVFNIILKKVLVFLMLFSIFLYIFYPNIGRFHEGYNIYTFVGIAANRNSYLGLILPLIISIFILKDTKKSKMAFHDKILILIAIITVFFTKSVTSIISLITFFIVVFVSKNKSINIIKYIRYFILIIWILDIIFIGFNLDFSNISSRFANKSTTMSGRTIIWQKTMYYFKKNPLIGYGYDNDIIGRVDNYSLQGNDKFPNDTHNSVLFLLLSSGIIGTIVLLYIVFRVLKMNEIVCRYDSIYIYLFSYMISHLISGLTESCIHYPHMIFFVYMIYIYIRYYELKKGEIEV